MCFVLFQAEDGIRDLVRSRGLGDVYKRQLLQAAAAQRPGDSGNGAIGGRRGEQDGGLVFQHLSLIHI